MIEVFKTNVQRSSQATRLVALLLQHFPQSRISFDLHDCDKILRVEGRDVVAEEVILIVRERGFMCMALE